jgi:hypothetical protein
MLLMLVVHRKRQIAEPVAAADGGRDIGFEEFLVAQRGRRG